MGQSLPRTRSASSALCRTFTEVFPNTGDSLARALRGASYRRVIDQEVAPMKKTNVAVIAGLLALAAVLGTVAATRTVSLGAAGKRATNATVQAAPGSSTHTPPRCGARSRTSRPRSPPRRRRTRRRRYSASSITGRLRS